ncbi:MAG: polyphenol oxidase family protein [Spirochaetota bacterium]
MKEKNFIQRENGTWEVSMHPRVYAGVVGRYGNGIDYTTPPEEHRLAEIELLSRLTGIQPSSIIMLQQVHGDHIVEIKDYPAHAKPWHFSADALVTSKAGICLVIRTADCVPVIITDPVSGMLGIAHSGWRGCRLDITGKLVDFMIANGGCRTENMAAAILPAIGPHSYEVGQDVARFFPGYVENIDGSLFLNLWKTIQDSLRTRGLSPSSIISTGRCTLDESEHFFSYRGGDAGRNLNFAFLR